MLITDRILSPDHVLLLRSAPSSNVIWPRLHADEFVVLIVKGENFRTLIRCDTIQDAVDALEATLLTTISQYFYVAERA